MSNTVNTSYIEPSAFDIMTDPVDMPEESGSYLAVKPGLSVGSIFSTFILSEAAS